MFNKKYLLNSDFCRKHCAVNIMLVHDVFYRDTKCSFNLYLKFLTLSFLSCNFDLLEDDDIFTLGGDRTQV